MKFDTLTQEHHFISFSNSSTLCTRAKYSQNTENSLGRFGLILENVLLLILRLKNSAKVLAIFFGKILKHNKFQRFFANNIC